MNAEEIRKLMEKRKKPGRKEIKHTEEVEKRNNIANEKILHNTKYNNYSEINNNNITTEKKPGIGAKIFAWSIIIMVVLFIFRACNKNKNENMNNNIQNLENVEQSDNLVKVKGYKYQNSNTERIKYDNNVTHWLDKLYVEGVDFYNNNEIQNAYVEYCRLVNEIEKIDKNMIPGTNNKIQDANYNEVDNAYKNHLKEISQIRQIFDNVNGNDDDLEKNAGCNYKGTKWNTQNSKYKANDFKSNIIDDRWKEYEASNIVSRYSHLDLDTLEQAYVEVVNYNNSDYLLNYNKEELAILRNMLMAYKGYRFKKGKYKVYFESKNWYNGYIDDQSQIVLNDYEKYFVETITKYEKR